MQTLIGSGPIAGSASRMFGPLHHVGIVCADRDVAIANFEALLGPCPAYRLDTPVTARIEGETITFAMRLGFFRLGECMVEIIEPRDQLSPHAAFLRSHGGGIHHAAFLVPSIAEARQAMPGGGIVVADGTIPENELKWAYLQAPGGGTVIELVERGSVADAFFKVIYDTIDDFAAG